MRRFAAAALLATAVAFPVASAVSPTVVHALPAGFSDVQVAAPGAGTGIVGLPNGKVLMLVQSGSVRLISNDVLQPQHALDMSLAPCNSGERGLLGVAIDPDFVNNGYIYLYFTHPSAAPGGCVNRASRFTMSGDAIDPNSEVILVDNIASQNGNHNGGDLEIGGDGYLYISVGDSGTDPRGRPGINMAAQDLSLLQGKILRVVPSTGDPAPGNPISGPGTASCRVRGNTAATPTSWCQELYAWGLRNPFRFAFDPNTGPDRFFINDVGQSTREEVDQGGIGLNFGWPIREGVCPQGQDPPCPAADPAAGYTDPLTDYPRTVGHVITAAAFIPNGHWPAEYDGGYLFADGYSGNMFLRRANGSVDYNAPFAAVGAIADMAFVTTGDSIALYYTQTSGAVHKISIAPAPVADPGPLTFVAQPPGNRVLDTRSPEAGNKPMRANTTRYVPLGVNPGVTKAVLVNFAFVGPTSPGYLTAWEGRTARTVVSNINAAAGEVVANAAIDPVDPEGGILVYSFSTTHVVIDVMGYFNVAPTAVSAGRFIAVAPNRLADTRQPASASNSYSRGQGATYPFVRVPVAGRGGLPGVASIDAAVLVVTAVTAPNNGGGWLSASPGGAPFPGSSNLNTNGFGDIRANLVVVPVAADGTVDFHLLSVPDVVVDVAGYFTSSAVGPGTAGRFHVIQPHREVDTRIPEGFGPLTGSMSRSLNPTVVPDNAGAMAQTITIVGNVVAGFVTPYPGGTLPVVSAGNTNAPNQIHAVLSFTQMSAAPASMTYFTSMATDLVVDVPGYFEGS
jgi:glucose/arabinose dehydrogenase